MNQRKRRYGKILLIQVCLLFSLYASAQCPPNIGFENGTLSGWECSMGEISPDIDAGTSTISLSPSGPTYDIHTLQKLMTPQFFDPYGKFPINCPNGSDYSIKLGNDQSKRKAQQVSYTFTIPVDDDNYSIIYNYAVVFQNPSDHKEFEQPRFTANVFDVSSGQYIGCSSFSYAAFGDLQGLGFISAGQGRDVFFKGWTPVTIKLSGYAGKTIRLEFTSNDCTKGGHFGYAYIDVNQNCSSPISGSTQCFNDTVQTLIAPFGFAGYRWLDGNDLSKEISHSPSLVLKPLPASGTKYAVEITPFPNQGCIDTVYTSIKYSSDVIKLNTPVNEVVSCVQRPIDLTANSIVAGSSPGLTYNYYIDPALSQYSLSPKYIFTSGTYYIKASNSVGCVASSPVTIRIADFPSFKIASPPVTQRPNSFDLAASAGNVQGVTFTYWKDSLTTIPLPEPTKVVISGRYFVKATIEGGCAEVFGVTVIIEEALISPPNAFSPNGDAINDTWEIPLLASLYPDCTVDIFNRLGQLVFHSSGYGKTWDGKFKGIDQPVATYYYVIRARSDLPPVGGSVTIVR